MASATQAMLLYDGQCALCRASVALLRRLDWFQRVHCVDARDPEQWPTFVALDSQRLLEEMHLVPASGQPIYHGFGALRWLAWRLPLLWPLAPFLHLPGVVPLGQRVYLWVARNRFKLVPCAHGVCTLPTIKR